jgi:endonuclease III
MPETPLKAVKKESSASPTKQSPSKASGATPDALRSKKLKAYAQYASKSPFPDFPHPTPDEARLAHRILASIHGARTRPTEVKAPTSRAGCGDSPSVLDALVRTILSQNTSDVNSTRAKRSMDAVYGGSDAWEAIAAGGAAKLQEAIKCGGLAGVKSKVITNLLSAVKERHGCYSLDHLFKVSDDEAMRELIGFPGVGPKTASCVLLFCLGRESFAVDTHVWRITGLLGWRPPTATRDETYAHLDVRIPDEDKYALHILLVGHGKKCEECRAGGKNLGKCELRKAFKKGARGVKPEMPDIKAEVKEEEEVKEESSGSE